MGNSHGVSFGRPAQTIIIFSRFFFFFGVNPFSDSRRPIPEFEINGTYTIIHRIIIIPTDFRFSKALIVLGSNVIGDTVERTQYFTNTLFIYTIYTICNVPRPY